MNRTLPPLKSLTSFEAAARHRSFTLAARELNVTQSAISHQVKSLENYLGVVLFSREKRHLTLTQAGRALQPEVGESLDRLSEIIVRLKQPAGLPRNTLSVRMAPAFALAWLSPRLPDFWRQYPEIELCLYHSHAVTDFDRENIDIAVTYGRGDWPNVNTRKLMKLDFFPVCSPALVKNASEEGRLEAMRTQPLIHEVDFQWWADWLTRAGIDEINPYKGLIIDDTNVLVQAAVDGKGIALGSSVFVRNHLAEGTLVRLSDVTLENDDGYFVVQPENRPLTPLAVKFSDWLFDKAGHSPC